MKVNQARSAGFCFGVKRAITIALDTAASGSAVYMLGEIVHNEDVVSQVEKAGIRKISRLGNGKGKVLLIRAHGAPRKIIHDAKKSGYRVVDATCPMVKEIHRIALRMEKQCEKIIVIGDKKHDEVLGIIGQLKSKALVIDTPGHVPLEKISRIKKACVVVQSTQNSDNVGKIFEILKSRIRDIKLFNTICKPTIAKQTEIRILPLTNDVVVVIGSRSSANTRRLYEISRSLNRRTYWVNSRKEIDPGWFKNAKCVGITAGASTPDATTREIASFIAGLN
jgi:4-hydroxy-3-methylbut-2-en-1-yl diphosphate reductase